MTTILAVQSFKGGTGKSTITANLAVTLAQLNKRVAVVDLDLEGPGLHVIFGVSDNEVRATINDVLQRSALISEAAVDLTSRLKVSGGCLLFCPAGHKLDEMLKMVDTGLNLSLFRKALEDLAIAFRLDYVLIDSHPGLEKDTILSMALSDVVLLISRVDQQDISGSGVMREVAGQLNKPVVLILNMLPNSVGQKEAQKVGDRLAHLFNMQVLMALPFNSDVFENLSRGVFVLERPKDPLTKMFTELAGSILEAVESRGRVSDLGNSEQAPQPVGQ